MRKTKIIATIGPASQSQEQLKKLAEAGMNVARQNMSHSDHDQHRKILDRIHSLPHPVAAMIDTQGPEVRLREVKDGTTLDEGDTVEITADEVTGDSERLSVDHEELLARVEQGDTILIDDGEIELEVTETGRPITCTVQYGGPVSTKKSVNVPGKDIGLETPTEKDREDIKFGAEHGFDFLSASFIKKADDVRAVREIVEQHNSKMDIIAKIEHIKAVENFDEILEAADGIMVARGDLGVEMPASEVPILQKEIIKKCNRKGKPVITATQMLKSMTQHPRATRAEASDVANAIIDGTDAVMLSEETAVGKYPVKSLEFMAEIAGKVESTVLDDVHHTLKSVSTETADIICKNIWRISQETDIDYIVAHTSSGYTARNVAKYRPATDIIALTDSEAVARQLQVVWGVQSLYTEFPDYVDEMICNSAEILHDRGMVEKDDTLGLTAGIPVSVPGTTNMIEIRDVESLLKQKEDITS